MQDPTSAPVHLPTHWEGVPYWIRIVVGFLLIGIGASIAASQLRGAFPPPEDPKDPKRRALHYLSTPLLGMGFAMAAPFALPGFGLDSRWLIGLVAPFLWMYLYDAYKPRAEKSLGISLPESKDILQPRPPTTPGEK